MSFTYQNRQQKRGAASRQSAPTGGLQSVPNSAFAAAGDSGMAAGELEQAMRGRMESLFGRDFRNERAEAEAEQIGSRFSGATSIEDLKSKMGDALGADFSSVRFHTGAEASAMAAASQADGFTTGRDIYLGTDGFDPVTAAHEMVHTVQQGAVQASAPVMSAPAGAVQYRTWNPFKKAYKKTIGAHYKALDQFNNYNEDYKKMSRAQRFKWTIQNPLARLHALGGWTKKDSADRKKKLDDEMADANKLSGKWGDLGDADPGGEGAGEYDQSGVEEGIEATKDVLEDLHAPSDTVVGHGSNALGLADAAMQLDSIKGTGDFTGAETKGIADISKGAKSGMIAANAVSGAVSFGGDTLSAVGNTLDAVKDFKQGNIGGGIYDSTMAAADMISMGGDIGSALSGAIPVAGTVASGMSGVANTMRTAANTGAAIGNTHTQYKLYKRGKKYAEDVAKLEQKKAGGSLSDEEKYQLSRARAVKQGQRAARIRKNENIVGAVSSGIRAVGDFTGMGLDIAGGGLAPVGAVANLAGNGLGAATDFIGGKITKEQKRAMRKDVVNQEIGLDDKIAALRSGDAALYKQLGITDPAEKEKYMKMSKSKAKRVILKSMGFETGKRKEAFNQITQRRAKMLTDRANAASGNEEEIGIMKDMHLHRVGGKYQASAVAEKLGLEELDEVNPFAQKAEEHQAALRAKSGNTSPPANTTASPPPPPPASTTVNAPPPPPPPAAWKVAKPKKK